MNEKIQQTYPVFDFWWYACDAIDFGTFLADLLRDFVVVVVNEVVIAAFDKNKFKLASKLEVFPSTFEMYHWFHVQHVKRDQTSLLCFYAYNARWFLCYQK